MSECETCQGKGYVLYRTDYRGFEKQVCRTCGGRGMMSRIKDSIYNPQSSKVAEINVVKWEKCPHCNGTGKVKVIRMIKVTA